MYYYATFISCTAHVQPHPAGLTCCCRDCRLFRRRALSALAPLRASWLHCNCSCNTQHSVIDCNILYQHQMIEFCTWVQADTLHQQHLHRAAQCNSMKCVAAIGAAYANTHCTSAGTSKLKLPLLRLLADPPPTTVGAPSALPQDCRMHELWCQHKQLLTLKG